MTGTVDAEVARLLQLTRSAAPPTPLSPAYTPTRAPTRTRTHVPPTEVPLAEHAQSVLEPNESLRAGQTLWSDGGEYNLHFQEDGNLVLYRTADGEPIWSTDTAGTRPGRVIMQDDGNFILYNARGEPIWATETTVPDSRLVVQNDGSLVIRDPDGARVWQSGPGDALLYYPIRVELRSTSDWSDLVIQNHGAVVSAHLVSRDGDLSEYTVQPGHLWMTQPMNSAERGLPVVMTVDLILSAQNVPEALEMIIDKGYLGTTWIAVSVLDGERWIPLAHMEHTLNDDAERNGNTLAFDMSLAALGPIEPRSGPLPP